MFTTYTHAPRNTTFLHVRLHKSCLILPPHFYHNQTGGKIPFDYMGKNFPLACKNLLNTEDAMELLPALFPSPPRPLSKGPK